MKLTPLNKLVLVRFLEASTKMAPYIAGFSFIFDQTKSGLMVGLAMFAFFGSLLFFMPVAGAIIDRHHKVMMYAALVSGVIYFIAGFLSPVLLIVAFAVIGITASPFAPGVGSLVPHLVTPQNNIQKINAQSNIGKNVGYLFGPIIAAISGMYFSHTLSFILAGIGSIFSYFLLKKLFSEIYVPDKKAKTEKLKLFDLQDLQEGFNYAKQHKLILSLTGIYFVAFLCYGIIIPGEVVLAEFFNTGSWGYPSLIIAWGAGAIAGNFIAARLSHANNAFLLLAACIITVVSMLLVGFATNFILIILFFVIGGYGDGKAAVIVPIMVQKYTQPNYLGRVFGLIEAAAALGMAVPAIFVGIFIDHYGIQNTYIAGAVMCSIAFIFIPTVFRQLKKSPTTYN